MTVVELRAKGAPHSALVTAKGLVAALDIGTTKITCLIGEAVAGSVPFQATRQPKPFVVLN